MYGCTATPPVSHQRLGWQVRPALAWFLVLACPVLAAALQPPHGGLDFDGRETFVVSAVNAGDLGVAGAAPRTVEAWVNASDFNYNAVFSLGTRGESRRDFSLFATEATDRWCFVSWGDDVYFSHPSRNRWVHLALVYDGSEVMVYADGRETARKSLVLDTSTEQPFRIGRRRDDRHDVFHGRIAEFRIWNRALEAQEIRANMLVGLAGDEDGLVGYWPLSGDVREDRTASDLAGGNHGRWVGRIDRQGGIAPLDSGLAPEQVEQRPYRAYVQDCLETLMEYGTDRYGEVQSAMLANLLDVRTRTSPEDPPRGGPAPTGCWPPTFPTPYSNRLAHATFRADRAWGDHRAWQWQPVPGQLPAADARGPSELSFAPVRARALCLEVQLQDGFGGGIYEWMVNGQRAEVKRRAATYFIENPAAMSNAVYDERFPYDLQRIHDGRTPGAGGDAAPAAFRWLELPSETARTVGWSFRGGSSAGRPVPLERWQPRRGTREWVMIEFDEPIEVSSVQVYWLDDGQEHRVPADWNVLWADTRDGGPVEYPPAPYVPWSGEFRDSFWQPRGSNFFYDQPTFRAMDMLSRITGDPQYGRFATESLAAAMQQRNEAKGLFWWGRTQFYDIFSDRQVAPNNDPRHAHGLRRLPAWQLLWETDPDATRQHIEAMWEWHVVDKDVGRFNRYDNRGRGIAFIDNGATMISAFAFLYSKTGDPRHLHWARTVAGFHWGHRDKTTNLTPEQPEQGHRREAGHAMTMRAIGTLPTHLLLSWQWTGEDEFRDQAVAYLTGFARHAYLPERGKFTTVDIATGRPVDGRRGLEPTDPVELWGNYHLIPGGLYLAQGFAFAYALTGEEELLDAARKCAEWIRRSPPEAYQHRHWSELYQRVYARYGTFADHYGRAISFFLQMYAVTGEEPYLDDARRFARDAVAKLYYQGLFRGHPARPYYSNIDGVGRLLVALLQLDRVLARPAETAAQQAVLLNEDDLLDFGNW